jgi:hypothetical protein
MTCCTWQEAASAACPARSALVIPNRGVLGEFAGPYAASLIGCGHCRCNAWLARGRVKNLSTVDTAQSGRIRSLRPKRLYTQST